jgi:hypothetical protein
MFRINLRGTRIRLDVVTAVGVAVDVWTGDRDLDGRVAIVVDARLHESSKPSTHGGFLMNLGHLNFEMNAVKLQMNARTSKLVGPKSKIALKIPRFVVERCGNGWGV